MEEDAEENSGQRLADGREETPLHGLPFAMCAVVEWQGDGDASGMLWMAMASATTRPLPVH